MNIAVIGLGFMGSTHLKAYKNIPSARLVVVVDGDEKRLSGDLSDIQGNIGGPGEKYDFSKIKTYSDFNEAMRDPDIEAVDICLPTDLHAPVALAAIRAGKHTLVEKPLAIDGATAEQIVQEARRSGKTLMCGQVLRFVRPYRKTADMIAAGELGQVRSAFFRRRCAAPFWSKWLNDAGKSGGGVFDLLIHDVDYCLHAFGAPESVSAWGYEDMPRGIDWISAQFHYPKIGSVVVTGGWHHPKAYPFSMEFTIVSDAGTLEFDSKAAKPLTMFTAEGEEKALEQDEIDIFQAEIEYFLDCAANGKRPDMCPPEESAQAVRLAQLMVESRSRNGERLQWKP
jgi:predicted dehydrogenase